MADSPQRAIDPQRLLLRALAQQQARLAIASNPAIASTILDRLVQLRLLADLGIEPDHLATILTSAAPWTTAQAICRALHLPLPAHPPLNLLPLPAHPPLNLLPLCHLLTAADPPPIDLLGRLHERSLPDRKQTGSFYTPAAIVRSLIIHLELDGRSPEQLARIRICDLACGAGSFLLAAYEALLAAHERWYLTHRVQAVHDGCVLHPDLPPSLSLDQRRTILGRSIFGTDLDAHALQLAHRALHLRMHAGHPGPHAAITTHLRRLDALEPGALEHHFAAFLPTGHFDAIIGNPPYVRPQHLAPADKATYRAHYTAFKAKADLYVCFMQRAADLLRPGGRLALVVARGWLALDSFDELRRHLLAHYSLTRLTLLPPRSFPDAQVDTLALVFTREPDPALRDTHLLTVDPPLRTIPQRAFTTTYRNVFDLSIEPATEAIKAIMRQGPTLGSRYAVVFGLKTGDDRKFLHRNPRRPLDRPLLRGDDIHRYGHTWTGEYVRYDPAAMRAHRTTARPGEPARFEQPKLLVKDTTKDLGATWDDGAHYVKDVLIVLPRPGTPAYHLKALLGVLNSQALRFYYRTTFPTLHVQNKELASLPLPRFDLTTKSGRHAHDRLVALVDQRLDLEGPRRIAGTDVARQQLATRIRTLERRIDQLVCTHYGLDAAAIHTLTAAIPQPAS